LNQSYSTNPCATTPNYGINTRVGPLPTVHIPQLTTYGCDTVPTEVTVPMNPSGTQEQISLGEYETYVLRFAEWLKAKHLGEFLSHEFLKDKTVSLTVTEDGMLSITISNAPSSYKGTKSKRSTSRPKA